MIADNEVDIHFISTSSRGGLASPSRRGRAALRGAGSGRGEGRGGTGGSTGMTLCSFGGNDADVSDDAEEYKKGVDEFSDKDQDFGLFDDGPDCRSPVHKIIDHQDFTGFWAANAADALSSVMGIDTKKVVSPFGWTNLEVTLFVVCWLEKEMAAEKEVWDLVVEKAREWVVENCGKDQVLGELEERVKATLKRLR